MASAFAVEVRDRLGLGERMVRIILRRAEIVPDVRARIALTALARKGSELDQLVKLLPAEQRAVVGLILSGRPAAPKTVKAAVAMLAGKRTAPATSDDELQFKQPQALARCQNQVAKFGDLLGVYPCRQRWRHGCLCDQVAKNGHLIGTPWQALRFRA